MLHCSHPIVGAAVLLGSHHPNKGMGEGIANAVPEAQCATETGVSMPDMNERKEIVHGWRTVWQGLACRDSKVSLSTLSRPYNVPGFEFTGRS